MAITQREIRYLTAEELIRLRRYAEARALQAQESSTVTAIRSWALLDTQFARGAERADLRGLGLQNTAMDTIGRNPRATENGGTCPRPRIHRMRKRGWHPSLRLSPFEIHTKGASWRDRGK